MVKQHTGQRAGDLKIALPHFIIKRISEGSFILVLTTALFVLLSLITYHPHDPGLSNGSMPTAKISNAGGQVGAYIADALYCIFGYFAYLIPLCFAYIAGVILKDYRAVHVIDKPMLLLRSIGLLLLLTGGCGLLALNFNPGSMPYGVGGIMGKSLGFALMNVVGIQGTILILFSLLLIGLTWLTGLSWVHLTEILGEYAFRATHFLIHLSQQMVRGKVAKMKTVQPTFIKPSIILEPPKFKKERIVPPITTPVTIEKSPETKVPRPQTFAKVTTTGKLPSLTLLDKGQPGVPMGGYSHQELELLSREVEQHLLDFGIQADVVAVHPGPVITRFELQLAAGIKVSKLTALAKDLARSLSVTSVRVVEIIPGKTVVGIELPNQNRAMVSLSDVLSAEVYQQAHSPLTLALGVDIAGHPMVVDLAKMPHLLVAGTTGSGKSVGINAMILSLLFKASPKEVRLIMVDPKMLELSVYDGIPHLLTPVVTDMKEAASALRWCVAEMERRYRLMASLGVRNLAGFNTRIAEAQARQEPLVDPLWKAIDGVDSHAPELQPLPYVVVIIDELADMMMVVGKKVEQLIARIAQKARAAGIHLILATQRPSVDVLTGLIKSNIPTRISFQVSSKIDSRTILDQQGAEQLLGHGDMLFLAPGTGAPLRVHGAFVEDREVHRVADDWRARGAPEYMEEITQIVNDNFDGYTTEEEQAVEEADPLYDQAVAFVIQTRKASISAVQRRFKIGYNRAARLVEEMERTGVVGPLDGGFRDILVSAASEE